MFEELDEKEKSKYLSFAKQILKNTFVECKDCGIYSGSGYFVISYNDEKKLREVAEKIYEFMLQNK